jgi:hypothetical protein
MSKIPTAEEYCEQTNRGNISGGWEDSSQYEEVKKLMVEFANLHVQAALEAAAKKATYTYRLPHDDEDEKAGFKFVAIREQILKAYSPDLIK